MQRVMVTGSHGYIGSVLLPFLHDAGFDVVGRDLGLYANSRYPSGGMNVTPWDTRRAEPSDFDGIDTVIHLAALSNDPLGELRPRVTHRINHDGTVRVAEAAKRAGVTRFVFASSCSLYGASDTDDLIDEAAPMAPVTEYAESKVTAEAALTEMADDDFSPVFMRNATVYGPSPSLRLDIVVNNLCAAAVATGIVLLKSDGTPWRPQVHVTDIARSIIAVIEAPRDSTHAQAFNVGRSDQNLRVLDIAELVAAAIPGGAEIVYESGAGPDPRSYRVDFSKIEQTLPGFIPKWTVEEGVRELIEVFTESGLGQDEFARYYRLREVQRLIAEGKLTEDLEWR